MYNIHLKKNKETKTGNLNLDLKVFILLRFVVDFVTSHNMTIYALPSNITIMVWALSLF